MAKDMVTLALIFTIVFSVLSPAIDVTKAEIVEKRDLMPLTEDKNVLATNEAPSRRYGPFIQQPIFSIQDASEEVSLGTLCSYKHYVDSCDKCDSECKMLSFTYGQCEGLWPFRECYCYITCGVVGR
ncbi:uncharacterized protein LOC111831726 [Capsella rubella]|uniref:uncharacterized protein LOC111831726 n=1 Tax=Capsella rubella TaxID=81985 RepID=UPI000CD549C0|nr:uncharacterized protein LOC111831726 [Capsella rubella]